MSLSPRRTATSWSPTTKTSAPPARFLYHRPGIKSTINNIKEEEDWEVLIVADPRAISDTASARHEFVHKFSLYNNRVECPVRDWEDLLDDMKAYRRAMSQR